MDTAKIRVMAWRNLWRNSRRTALTLISIAFGGFLAIIMTAMQDRSFTEFIDAAARQGSGHITIQHPEYLDKPSVKRSLILDDDLLGAVSTTERIERYSERISGEVMLASARDSFGVPFIAYDPAQEDPSSLVLLDGMVEGDSFRSADDHGIILGRRLARNLDVELGKKVVFTFADKEGEIVSGLARLSGIIETGVTAQEAMLCLLPIGTVRELLGYRENEATMLTVFLEDSRRSIATAAELNQRLPSGASALTWQEVKPELAGFIAMKIGGGRVMEVIIGLLVAAGIFNTLFVSVMERIREFGIMMAIGYSPSHIFRLVLWESAWLGLLGLLLCGLLTAGPYAYLATHGIDFSAMMTDAPEIGGIGWDPVIQAGIFPEHLIAIVVAIVLATICAGLVPARRACRVEPVDSIRLV